MRSPSSVSPTDRRAAPDGPRTPRVYLPVGAGILSLPSLSTVHPAFLRQEPAVRSCVVRSACGQAVVWDCRGQACAPSPTRCRRCACRDRALRQIPTLSQVPCLSIPTPTEAHIVRRSYWHHGAGTELNTVQQQ